MKIECVISYNSTMHTRIHTKIAEALISSSDEKTQLSSLRYFKEAIQCHGVKSAVVGRIGKEFFALVKDNPKSEIFDVCEALWQTGYMEESFIACNWSYYLHKNYEPADFKVFEKWVQNYVSNWASCDTLCNHTVGTFLEMFPEYLSALKKWSVSSNRWMRRASAVSLIVPARKGKFLSDILEIADILLQDKDDMVQKGYGWMLKVSGQAHQKAVFDYVMERKAVMPRTSLRYAIEKMPRDLRAQAMAK